MEESIVGVFFGRQGFIPVLLAIGSSPNVSWQIP